MGYIIRMGEVVVELTSTKTQLTVGYVKAVENAKEVRKLLMSVGLPDTLLVKSSLIPSPLVVAVAANKADLARKRENMKTRSVQTETLYNLSSSKNITESLKNFGGGDSDQSFVVAGFGVSLEAARGVIRGQWSDIAELEDQVDLNLLRKLQKLQDVETSTLEASLVSRIAAKDAL